MKFISVTILSFSLVLLLTPYAACELFEIPVMEEEEGFVVCVSKQT